MWQIHEQKCAIEKGFFKETDEITTNKQVSQEIQCFICGDCDNSSLEEIEKHIQSSHPDLQPYIDTGSHLYGPSRIAELQCKDCKQVLPNTVELAMHICGKPHPTWLGISMESMFKCELCQDEVLGYLRYLQHIILFHEPDKYNKLIKVPDFFKNVEKQCKKCDFVHKQTGKFREHMQLYHGEEVECQVCKNKFIIVKVLLALRCLRNGIYLTNDERKKCATI